MAENHVRNHHLPAAYWSKRRAVVAKDLDRSRDAPASACREADTYAILSYLGWLRQREMIANGELKELDAAR